MTAGGKPSAEAPAAPAFGAPRESAHPLRAIGFKLIAIGCFSMLWALIKGLGPEFPSGQIVFARSLFAFIPVAFMIHAAGGFGSLKTKHPLGHVMRSISGTLAMALSFTALTMIPLVDAVAIGFAVPLFTTVLAAWILSEDVRVYRWSAIGVGFVGVLVILQPSGLRLLDPGSLAEGEADYAIGAMLALLAAFFVGMAMVSIRRMAGIEKDVAIVFYFTLTSTVASGLTLFFAWRTPEGVEWLMLIGIGLIGGVGQIFLTLSYRLGQASLLAPFDYTAMLYALVIGYLVFSEVPSNTTLAGAAVVVSAGLFIVWRERVRHLIRSTARRGGVGPGGFGA